MGADRRALHITYLEDARLVHRPKVIARAEPDSLACRIPRCAEISLGHFLSMCDDTGLLQHAVHTVPDRAHGYCVDDNARALMLVCGLDEPGEQPLSESHNGALCRLCPACLESRYRSLSKLHGLQPELARRLAPKTATGNAVGARRMCAERCELVTAAMGGGLVRRSPVGGWDLSLASGLGLHASGFGRRLRRRAGSQRGPEIRHPLADRLVSSLALVEAPHWVWFEEVLAYDNARLPEALIPTGLATQTPGLCRCRLANPALADDSTNGIDRTFPAGWYDELRRTSGAPRGLRSAAAGSERNDRGVSDRGRADGDAEWKSSRPGSSPGSSATTICRFRWLIPRRQLRDGLHPIVSLKIAAASWSCPICWIADIRQLRAPVSI